jgi:four helix bundle protein
MGNWELGIGSMKKDNVIQQKSYAFAVRIVKVYQYLCDEKREFTLSKQLLRCGTSVGANVEEAIGGQSDKDFFAKLTISYKEARETQYWIRLLTDTGYLSKDQSDSLLNDIIEIQKIIGSIQKTIKSRNSPFVIRN